MFQENIENKYKLVSKLPDWLFPFTFPMRKKAVELLQLQKGQSVMDVGCGTGASFEAILSEIGGEGQILAIDASSSMTKVALQRISDNKWRNIEVVTELMENVQTEKLFDGALLFAMHDVFNSKQAIDKIYSLLKPGGHVVCIGPKKPSKYPYKLLSPIFDLMFKRMAISQENKDMPWRKINERFKTVAIYEKMNGLIFIYVGLKE